MNNTTVPTNSYKTAANNLRIVAVMDKDVDMVVQHVVQKWFGFRKPFGLWLTATVGGKVLGAKTEKDAVSLAVRHFGVKPATW